VAVHNGPFVYSSLPEDLARSEVLKEVEEIEHKYTEPGSLSISEMVRTMLDHLVLSRFKEKRVKGRQKVYVYKMNGRKG